MAKRKTKQKRNLVIILSTALAAAAWIGFDIYQAFHQPAAPLVSEEQLEPLDPQLDQETLHSLQKRKTISQEKLDSFLELATLELPTEATPEGIIEQ